MTSLDPVRWRAASAQLDRVLELSSDERAQYLASLRERDATLAADVESLLEEQRVADDAKFLGAAPDRPASDATTHTSPEAVPRPRAAGAMLESGTAFGPYRIVGRLGRGGMGVVYEAEEIDSGRRVALKVLEERLTDERERERFHREGRLAASINHPHCVFVFAASEVDGRLAIAMELMQGTLAERLKAHGPLPPAHAVDVVLQLISGLQAASALGILHRDIKPSNCFVDADGTVKIGDFGISRSLRPTEETAFSTRTKFAATPAYASPEQLRGAALDARSDIYSLGATLYELLTGRRPIERDDLMALLMAVANDAPQPPHALVPAVPKGLSQVVLRCLAKQPHQRFTDYESLAAALAPYSSAAATAATLGRRALAGFIDFVACGLPSAAIGLLTGMGALSSTHWLHQISHEITFAVLALLYFGTSESLWGASPGKAACGLTLVQADGRPVRAAQAIARVALYLFVLHAPDLATRLVWNATVRDTLSLVVADPFMLMLVLVFATARRRNGYAALHDLVTRTRVVERRRMTNRPKLVARPEPPSCDVMGRFESFEVLADGLPGMPPGWHRGIDARLRRPVWIRMVPPGTPAISPARRAITRPTRLRWLAGRRLDCEAWDAFEAVAGVPLNAAVAEKARGWPEVRWWLLDLAHECAAGRSEAVKRDVDSVWVLDGGGAKLIDDPAMDTADVLPDTQSGSDARFLRDVARTALRAGVGRESLREQPIPPHARAFVERLDDATPPEWESIVRSLEELNARRAEVTRGWRVLPIVVTTVLLLIWALLTAVGFSVVLAKLARVPVDSRVAAGGLQHLLRAERRPGALAPGEREALEIALASRYRAVLAETQLFDEYGHLLALRQEHRALAERLLRQYPAAPARPRESASAVLSTLESHVARERPVSLVFGARLFLGFLMVGLMAAAIVGVTAAVTVRGAFLRLAGLELVRGDGRPASRLRILVRTALAWSPVLLALLSMVRIGFVQSKLNVHLDARSLFNPFDRLALTEALWIAAILLLIAGAAIVIVRPSRGVHDWLAGTWIVPR